MHSPCLAAALDYLSRGWAAIPLCPHDHKGVGQLHESSCKSPGKAPLFAWKEYQERLPKPSELKVLWNRCPAANVGIAMGPASNLIGIDVDGDEGREFIDELAEDHELPKTLEFTTPGGGHRYLFLWPEFEVKIKSIAGTHGEIIRILAKGSQTVAPPSIHEHGDKYAWCPGHSPKEIKPAPCPQWLIEHLMKGDDHVQSEPAPKLVATSPPASQSEYERARLYLTKCDPAISGQGGHAQTYKIACKIVKGFALSEDQAFDLLWTHYNPRCLPPWTEKELRHKVADAMKSAEPTGHLLAVPKNNAQVNGTISFPVVVSRSFTTVTTKPVEWLWPKWIPLGKLSILDGDPGLGKSTMLLDLAARLSTSGVMPDGSHGPIGNVLLMSAEDAPEDTIRPRLEAAGANLDRIYEMSFVRKGSEDRPLEIPADLHLIEKKLVEIEARLLVIDPLMAFLCGADANKDQEIRRVLFKLSRVAEKHRCAIICMRHLNKGGGTKAIYRGNSSIAVIGQARVGLLVAEDPDDNKKRILAVSKCNLALKPTSLRFGLEPLSDGDVCRIGWMGTSHYVADQLVAPPLTAEQKEQQEHVNTKTLSCADLLKSMLSQGPIQVKELKKELIDADFSRATIERAAKQINVVFWSSLQDGKRIYWWRLPDTQVA